MRLIVLGSSGTYPASRKACSGFLIIEKDTRLLLDCGTGVLANLQAHLALKDLTGIIVSHMHGDHFLDLIPLRYALAYGNHHRREPLLLHFPPGGSEIWERAVAPLDETRGSFSAPFAVSEYSTGHVYRFGPLHVRFVEMRHYVPSFGIEICSEGKLVYSADTGPCAQLQSLARGADLFVCEATWLKDEAATEKRGHLTAEEAGMVAREAGVRRLVLTHVFPDVDANESLRTAKAAFGSAVSLAEEGETYIADAG